MRRLLWLMCALCVISACGQSAAAEPQTTMIANTPILPATSAPLPTRTPQAELSPVEARDEADPDIKQQLQNEGYDAADVEYIARTGVATLQIDATTWHLMLTTPTGHLIDQTISYAVGNPADIAKSVQHAPVSADEPGSFAYFYTISAKDAPPEMLEALRSAPVAYRPARMMMIAPPVRVAVDVEAILVNVKGFIKQFGKDKFGDFTKEYDKLVPDGKFKLNDRWNTVKASMYVLDAVWMFEKIWPYLNSIDYLQACAEKPWNPLTKKSYEENPQDQQRVFERLEHARNEIKYEGLYLYTIIMNKVLFMGVPGLGTITKFIHGSILNDYIKETEQRLKNLIAEMEKLVTPCNGWRFVRKTPSDTLYTFEGTKCKESDGLWTIEDKLTIGEAQTVSKWEILFSEDAWMQGKQDFLYTLENIQNVHETRTEVRLTGFTKNIVFDTKTITFLLDSPVTCKLDFYAPDASHHRSCNSLSYMQSSSVDIEWVEDESICQAEKADMMRFHNWQP
jgi:hypothetical protein